MDKSHQNNMMNQEDAIAAAGADSSKKKMDGKTRSSTPEPK